CTAGDTVPVVPVGTVLVRLPYVVVNTNNSGLGSLRQAVLDANANLGADAIAFDPAIFATPQTISLTGELLIADSVTITGPGSALLTVSGNNASRVFDLSGPGTFDVTLAGLTVAGGRANGLV